MQDSLEQAGVERQEGNNSNVTASKLLADSQFSLAGFGSSPIDRQYNRCVEEEPSTQGSVHCGDEMQHAWDAELNKSYNDLKKNLNPQQKDALLKSERQWMKYRDAEHEAIDNIYLDPEHGSITHPFAAFSRANIVRQRAVELQERNGDTTNSGPAPGDAKHPVEDQVANCQMGGIDCADRAIALWDKALNSTYQELRKNLDQADKDRVLKSEREWLKFRDLEFNLIDKLTDERFPGQRIMGMDAKADLVKQRVLQLQKQLDVASGNAS